MCHILRMTWWGRRCPAYHQLGAESVHRLLIGSSGRFEPHTLKPPEASPALSLFAVPLPHQLIGRMLLTRPCSKRACKPLAVDARFLDEIFAISQNFTRLQRRWVHRHPFSCQPQRLIAKPSLQRRSCELKMGYTVLYRRARWIRLLNPTRLNWLFPEQAAATKPANSMDISPAFQLDNGNSPGCH